jgi:hypothetical protein
MTDKLTRDEMMRLLQECEFGTLMDHPIMTENTMHFAALVAAAEREKWTVVAEQAMEALALFASDESDDGMMAISAHEALRAAIRARGET